MSARFAIPATSFVLKAMIDADLAAAYQGFAAPKLSIAPPPRPNATPAPAATGANAPPEAAQLYLFLHHVAPNAAYRSMALAYIESSGEASTKMPLVLDLHYMLAATGADLERETLLGIGMAALHRQAIVERSAVAAILGAVAIPANPTKLMERLTSEPLANPAHHPEQIKISQHPLDIDMSTKLWSALQSPIRPSAYYLVTTTFLETDDSVPDGPRVDELVIAARPKADRNGDPASDTVTIVDEPLDDGP
ncbi:DUF4255 domain-containing protein [Sphingopyxis macrogoltabida]|uniref:Pvc16 N-terminal domain-containing protein n=1 Tax=Sphingopyxis macrogoltabida TaxID=33050 RepID=A0AAC9FFC2_SPHMC|nr:DUF4255 domain-containing protein [Sphingopyxis macrogoltabida]ALJ13632.1 hypothetical protein LH19_12200 [Sphingopyxis macrogoltabida]AMU88923.1 hypothetical protein ATM17_07685 [Sphingopyxis macrogoltabida]